MQVTIGNCPMLVWMPNEGELSLDVVGREGKGKKHGGEIG
jgi:hypothetical protein